MVINRSYDNTLFDRGFTGHEHLWDFGLINMNGRMYDPKTCSFLSPDNNIQDPTSQQGFNRYAYCAYNPLKYVDPSGYRYYGYDEGACYRMIDEMTLTIQREWHLVYESAMESAQLTISMACCLYGHGQDTYGNGSGNHGSPGGGGSSAPYIEVQDNGDGTYTVVNGIPDADQSVYVIDDEGNRTLLGTMLTPYSFFNKNNNLVENVIINPSNMSGQQFWDDLSNNLPGVSDFVADMFLGCKLHWINSEYDFKMIGYNGGNISDYVYRGMMVDFGYGNMIVSGRDIGNFFAGYLFGYNGFTYDLTRLLFDCFQGGPEPNVSRYAQDAGFFWGCLIYYIQHNTIYIP